MDWPIEWDFEGEVTFLDPEDSGLSKLPTMGYFPSFRYPEFKDAKDFIARPVAGFRSDGTPLDELERLDSFVVFRFFFPDRDLYERLHRERLVPGRRIELVEGAKVIARGIVGSRQEALPAIQMEIERLVADLGDTVPLADAKEVLGFL